jgi:hypothetical protein
MLGRFVYRDVDGCRLDGKPIRRFEFSYEKVIDKISGVDNFFGVLLWFAVLPWYILVVKLCDHRGFVLKKIWWEGCWLEVPIWE